MTVAVAPQELAPAVASVPIEDDIPLLRREDDAKPTRETPPPAKVLFLDGLRGLAAMVVVIYHCGFLKVDFGQAAVDVFFVLSAFLLTMGFETKARALLDQQADIRQWGWTLLDYAVRRFLRVYPLFALTAIALSLLPPESQKQLFFVLEPEKFDLLKVLTFEMSNRYFVFWTLPLEIAYYCLIPPIVVGVLKLGRYWWVPMVPLSVFITYAGCTWFRMYSQPLGPHLPTFLTGSLAAFVYTRAEAWIQTRGFVFRWYHTVLLRAVEILNLLVLLSVQFKGLLFHWVAPNPVPQTPGDPFVHGNVAIVLVCEMLRPGALALVLEWELLRYLGKISFSVYLLHGFIVHSHWILRQQVYDWFFSVWILVFLVGTVSYHIVEVPCFKLANQIGAAIKRRQAQEKAIHTQTKHVDHAV